MIRPQMLLDIHNELIVDLFAGGGGMSEGILRALGRHPDIAINHNDDALSMHRANHPQTRHFVADVFEVCPHSVTHGRSVGHLHASPDCTHHSQAAGGQPRNEKRRALSWVVVRWAGQVKPRIITLENVKQVLQWGPLIAKRDKDTGRVVTLDKIIGEDGKITNRVASTGEVVPREKQYLVPDKKRAGKTWNRFVRMLEGMGYEVKHKLMVSADHGDGTTRERLYLHARCDGLPVYFPEPSYFKKPKRGQMKWSAAHEHIDFSIESQSIFDRKKPLAEATMRRIAKGMMKFVINNADPFIVQVTQSSANGVHDINNPLNTITTAKGGEFTLITPVMVQAGHGEGSGDSKRWGMGAKSVEAPFGTIVANGGGQALAMAHLQQHSGDKEATTESALRVSAFLISYYCTDNMSSVNEPVPTITTKDRLALVTVIYQGMPYLIVDIKLRMLKPKELYSAQGFGKNYIFTHGHDGRQFSVAEQVRMVGNSVSPNTAAALIRCCHEGDEMRLVA
ncbi:DNA cytosine methyltransferase [Methylotenera sp.]|uniref:DNA cytosine methyltransferase n=1 Tax=Methylotenera sp. TaxID=2051956 RepID=UPI002ED9776E